MLGLTIPSSLVGERLARGVLPSEAEIGSTRRASLTAADRTQNYCDPAKISNNLHSVDSQCDLIPGSEGCDRPLLARFLLVRSLLSVP